MYIPFWTRPPNKFIRYYEKLFKLKANAYGVEREGVETIAVFKDKNGKEQEMVASIK